MIQPHTFEWWKLWFSMLPDSQQVAMLEIASTIEYYAPSDDKYFLNQEPACYFEILKRRGLNRFLEKFSAHSQFPFGLEPGDMDFLVVLCSRASAIELMESEDYGDCGCDGPDPEERLREELLCYDHDEYSEEMDGMRMDMLPFDHEDRELGTFENDAVANDCHDLEDHAHEDVGDNKRSDGNDIARKLDINDSWQFVTQIMPWSIEWAKLDWLMPYPERVSQEIQLQDELKSRRASGDLDIPF